MNRREAIASALAGVAGLGSAPPVELSDRTKMLILSVDNPDSELTPGIDEFRATIKEALSKAGLGHVEVILLHGITAHTLQS